MNRRALTHATVKEAAERLLSGRVCFSDPAQGSMLPSLPTSIEPNQKWGYHRG